MEERTGKTTALNTHHIAKVIALVIMTIDHLGEFIFPDYPWWRAVGRITFPVWFFLVGHALSYRVHGDTVLWEVVLLLLNPFLGQPFSPVNALVTIIGCQLVLGQVEKRQMLARQTPTLLIACLIFLPITYPLMEYGTVGLLYALMGYAVRSKQMSWRTGKAIACVAFLVFVTLQQMLFQFAPAPLLFMLIGTGIVTFMLARFEHRPVRVTRPLRPLALAGTWWSRHSLQYYVVHRVMLQIIGVTSGILNPALRWF